MSRKLLIIGAFLISCSFIRCQNKPAKNTCISNCYNIMFYNVENLFDTIDDPRTNDNDFLPGSKKHWNKKKYYRKLNNIYKVIISAGEQPPALVGMCEVENELVLKNLIQNTPLEKFNYKYIHKDSPDPRGIDNALIYRPELFKPLNTEYINITFPFAPTKRTRDILYVKGIIEKDTFHVFVNHFPSRARGAASSASSRNYVAKVLRQKVDSLFNNYEKSKIIIIGDFNDEPDDECLAKVLGGSDISNPIKTKVLYNLSFNWLKNVINIGTIKYRGKWNVFDQIIVSGEVLKCISGLCTGSSSCSIFSEEFLLSNGKGNSGKSPFRTYKGPKYTGGFSDHLPVVLGLYKK